MYEHHDFIDKNTNKHGKRMRRRLGEVLHCNICEYKTAEYFSLEQHMRIHYGELLHCDVCDYKTRFRSALVRHKRIHSG